MTIEETIEAAVQKAIGPLITEINDLKAKVNGEYSKYPLSMQVKHVAEIMDLSMMNARELVEQPDFPKHRSGRRVIIPRDAFFKWFNEPQNHQLVKSLQRKRIR